MGIFSHFGHKLSHTFKHLGHKVSHAAGKAAHAAKDVAKAAGKQAKKIGSKITKPLDNLTGMTSIFNPKNIVLVLGVLVVAIVVLPKAIDSAGTAGQKIGDSKAGAAIAAKA